MENIEVFQQHAQEYDEWFERNRFAYESEILAVKRLLPEWTNGLEVGVGTGRFAVPLGIRVGVEPAKAMAEIARKRGIEVYEGKAEALPFPDSSFDLVLLIVTLCFVEDPLQALREAKRVLTPGGYLIIGTIDGDSFLGRLYEAKRKESKFYRHARIYPIRQILNWLEQLELQDVRTCQTIFKNPQEITDIEPIKEGYGEGGFVVISARKKASNLQG